MRITKRQFISQINKKRNEMIDRKKQANQDPEITATDIYNIFLDTLTEELFNGHTIMLKCFGVFKLKFHKGHRVQFRDNDTIDDYLKVQFVPSDVLSRQLRIIDPKTIDPDQSTDLPDQDINV